MAIPEISSGAQVPPVEGAGLAPDEVIADRYCVKRRLGSGGMGEAWLAEDRLLHRKLVLKRLTGTPAPGTAGATQAGRLLTEAKRATAIDSPHIAQVFDVCSYRGEWLLAMEYVAGRNLREVLSAPLPAETFFTLAIQIAETIETAHASGILHCDIKPENIMVTDQGFIKVLDFGLARLTAGPDGTNETVSVASAAAAFAGTPGYMAPEVLREAEPTAQSDIFSLGVVLYEMAGGRSPFRGRSVADCVQMTLAAEPSPLDVRPRGLPADLNRILKKALMKDPQRRYATVRDLLVDLKNCASGEPAAPRAPGTIFILATAGVVALLIAAGGLLLRWHRRAAIVSSPAAPKTRLLAVLPFRVIGPGDAADAGGMSAYSEGLREAITSSLASVAPSDQIDVLAASEVRAHALKTAEDAHRELGADLVIDGSYQQYRNEVRISCALIDAAGRVLRSDMVNSTLTDPFALEDNVVKGVLAMLQLSEPHSGTATAQNFGTQVPAAYDAYLRGIGYLRDFDIADNLMKAEQSFEQATQKDSRFAPAYAGLGEAQWAQYQAGGDTAKIAQARSNCGKAMELNPSVAEAQICEGTIDDGTGNSQAAQQAFLRARTLDPESDTAMNGLARTYEEMGKPGEAAQVYQQAIEARPAYWANYLALANFLVRRADYARAAAVLEHAVAMFPANSFLARRLGVIYFFEGQFGQAAKILEQALAERPHAEAWMDLGQVYLHQRQFGPAITALETAARMNPQSASVQADLADAYAWSGTQAAKAPARYQQALALSTSRLKVDPQNLDALMVASYCASALGERQQALAWLNAALQHAPEDAEVNYYAARVHARLGDQAAARRWAETAVAHGYSRADVISAPDLQAAAPAR